jgi:hypothetical protein
MAHGKYPGLSRPERLTRLRKAFTLREQQFQRLLHLCVYVSTRELQRADLDLRQPTMHWPPTCIQTPACYHAVLKSELLFVAEATGSTRLVTRG